MTTIHLDAKDVPQHLRSWYTGQKFQAIVGDEMTIPMDAGLWSGGSRTVYRAIKLATGETVEAPNQSAAPWDNERRERRVKIAPGFAVVSHVTFSGKDLGLRFYMHPDDAAKLLPAPVELSAHEARVLEAHCHLKSAYRVPELQRAGYFKDAPPPMTLAQIEEARASLKARGFLNAQGAVTTAGKNARP